MAGEDNYINEAYEVLQKLSADERKKLEYEAKKEGKNKVKSGLII